jgi:hypothetical protein
LLPEVFSTSWVVTFNTTNASMKCLRVASLVGSQRDFALIVSHRLPCIADHEVSRFALSKAIYGGQHGAGNQTMMVVALGDAHLAQITKGVATALEPWLAVLRRSTRLATAPLTFEVAAGDRSAQHDTRSDEQRSVDGTPIKAGTGSKSFERTDDAQAHGDANCKGHHLVEDLITASCRVTHSRCLLNGVDTQTASPITGQMNERHSKVYCTGSVN